MKKIFLTAVAAGALAAGGAASAQDIGAVIGNIFGYGTPQYSYGTQYPYGAPATPAVVAGTQPYYGNRQPYNTVYVDQYGRQVYVDQYGRHVVQSNNVYGNNAYGGAVYQGTDAWGRPVYNTAPYGTYAYGGSNWDLDGDGIANTRDRWPDDRRYY
ncbi:MAG: hypothetical protein EOO30_14385 [Comamonadaceae bacterium]|nr:MAG: hypothetical protein EOO30_14385 [Comamonadaceae bacterium]